jgi:hypothetical protein
LGFRLPFSGFEHAHFVLGGESFVVWQRASISRLVRRRTDPALPPRQDADPRDDYPFDVSDDRLPAIAVCISKC